MSTKKKYIFHRKYRGGETSKRMRNNENNGNDSKRQRITRYFRIRTNSKSEKDFIELNRLLTICDCYKDSMVEPNIGWHNQLFNKAVVGLFGGMKGTAAKVLEDIKREIMNNEEYGSKTPVAICWLQLEKQDKLIRSELPRYSDDGKANNNIINKLPDLVNYAFHDSGYSPVQVKPNIKQIVTPASYIDPGTRAKMGDEGVELRGTGIEISDELRLLGFEKAIRNFKGTLQKGNNIEIEMTFPNDTIYSVVRTPNNKNYDTSESNTDFFPGNTKKNEWLQENSKEMSLINAAKQYILCKEMGDTLQVVYAKIIMGEPNMEYCMFTTDHVIAARCRELGVPVCIQDREKQFVDIGKCNYYTPLMDEHERMKIFKKMYKKQSIVINQKINLDITGAVFSAEKFLLEKEIISVNEDIKNFFIEITQSIDRANEIVENIDINDNTQSLDYVKHMAAKYTAFSVFFRVDPNKFNGHTQHKINNSLKKLFPSTFEDDPIQNRIKGDEETLYSIIKILDKPGMFTIKGSPTKKDGSRPLPRARTPQSAGGVGFFPEKSATQEFYDTTKELLEDEYDMSEYNTDDYAYEFLCIMYVYLNYIGYTPTGKKILSFYLDIFIEGKLQNFTLDTFSESYTEFLKVDSVEETNFETRPEEKNVGTNYEGEEEIFPLENQKKQPNKHKQPTPFRRRKSRLFNTLRRRSFTPLSPPPRPIA